ncbi:MAG TPA: hypothetical protein VJV78_40085 [Polyangiales bacterium]|nr:hypothetical protein [Polyangiales bacterium]
MKRLLELQDSSPLVERAQELLGAAEPIDASPARGARIRRELDRPASAKVALWTRVPALAVAGFVLLFGASSFAALRLWSAATHAELPPATAPERDAADGQHATPRANPREAATPQPFEADTARELPSPRPSAAGNESRFNRAQRASRRVSRAAARPSEATAAAEPESMAPAPLETTAVAAPESASSAELPAAAADVPARSPAASPNSELVVRAVRALRRDGDPALAALLLDEYRTRRSGGPLGEEVLALQIEAAVANADPRAARFAREYLTRYSAGRYADTARRALAEQSP